MLQVKIQLGSLENKWVSTTVQWMMSPQHPHDLSAKQEYIEALEKKVEDLIDRKVNFYLASKQNPNQKSITLYENQ